MRKSNESNMVFIRDPQILPYFITKDQHCYTLNLFISKDKDPTKKNYNKTIGHYSNFGDCLLKVSKELTNQKTNYESISEYLETFREIESRISKLLEIKI